MVSGLLGMFIDKGKQDSLAEFLDSSSYDELGEIDLANDRCRNINHVEGKYFVPITDSSFLNQYRYGIDNMVHPDDREIFAQLMNPETISRRLAESDVPGAISAQYRYKLQDGTYRWTEVYVIGDGAHGLPKGIVRFYVFDIENAMRRRLGQESGGHFAGAGDRDERTGLLNEQAFLARIRDVVKGSKPGELCLIAIDLDHFRLFNEWYGREAGDFLLAEIGGRLVEEERAVGGLAGYLGRDDFFLLAPYDGRRIDALFDDLSALVSAYGANTGFTPVFGICMVDDDVSGMDLMDKATIAMGNAKADFRKRICIFRQPMHEQVEKEYRILSDFLHAIENNAIFFLVQPQCRMSDGKIVGAEALARWRKDDGSVVPPLDFVPVLERHGFITTLDCYVWEDVCRRIQAWASKGHKIVPISVNVSQVDFYLIDVPDYFQSLIDKYGIDPSHIKIEVTESAYVNNMAVIDDATRRLRENGLLVLMDDFGSGYSSLNTLRDLSVDVIKLDAQFLRFSDDAEHKGIHILESVINMAKSMGLPIICEGVETDEQVRFLERQGCQYVQGFKFYRPMTSEQFEEIIANEDSIDTRGFVLKSNEEIRVRELFDENVYSDSMLNSILGAVAMYSWHGDDVDITRFNEQFYQTINSPDFHSLRYGIQKLMPSDERPKLYDLLSEAEENTLTGSEGELRFVRRGGSVSRYFFRFYYLGEQDGGKRFYGSVRDVTELTELQAQIKLISRFSSDSLIFVHRLADGFAYSVVAHGLEAPMGLTADEFKEELNSGAFIERIEESDAQAVLRSVTAARIDGLQLRFRMRNANGERLGLNVKSDVVEDDQSDVIAILVFRAHGA